MGRWSLVAQAGQRAMAARLWEAQRFLVLLETVATGYSLLEVLSIQPLRALLLRRSVARAAPAALPLVARRPVALADSGAAAATLPVI